jgi:hypothetical protein
MSLRLSALALSLLWAATLAADEPRPGKATPADIAAVEKLLNTAAEWKGTGHQLDEATRKELAAQVAAIGNAGFRDRARQILPEIEKAAVLHARIRRLQAEIRAVKGSVTLEPGGSDVLRGIVGPKAMRLFDRLTAIDLCDHSIPIKSGIKNQLVTDDWLKCLAGLPDIRSLDVSVTVVRGPGLEHIATLKDLETLNLTLTLVTDDQLAPLNKLTNLRKLLLASTKCTGEGFEHLGALTKLENLNFHSAPVNEAGLEQISRLTNLERLEIVHTRFTDAGARHLAKLTGMRRLQLGSREATGAAVAPLRAMKQLRELDLYDGLVSAEGVRHAATISTLAMLRMYAGPVGDEGFAAVAKLTDLETLVAQQVGITDAGLRHLAGLKKLKRLDVQGNKLSAEAIARLKEALPGLEVMH